MASRTPVPRGIPTFELPEVLEFNGHTYGPDEVPLRLRKLGRRFTTHETLDRLVRWFRAHGDWPTKGELNITKLRQREARALAALRSARGAIMRYQELDMPSETTFRAHHGSLNNAIVLVGGKPRPAGRPPNPANELPPLPRRPLGADAIDTLYLHYRAEREKDPASMATKQAHYNLAMALIATGDRIDATGEASVEEDRCDDLIYEA